MGKKGKGKIFLIFMLVIFGLIAAINIFYKGSDGGLSNVEAANKEDQKVKILLDAPLYSRITPEELAGHLGKPVLVEDWSTGNGYKVDGYEYVIGDYTAVFLVVENSVKGIYLNESYNGDEPPLDLPMDETICEYLKVKPDSTMYNATTGNPYAVRLENVSKDIDVIWFTAGTLQIRYDKKYFA